MSVRMCVLGSGSGGNSTLLMLDDEAVLIDAGFGPRATPARLQGTGVGLNDLRAIIITHADRDHFNPSWYNTLRKLRIPVYCHHKHKHALYHAVNNSHPERSAHILHAEGLLQEFDDQPFTLELKHTTTHIRPIPLAHDRNGTCGFVITNHSAKVGYATDLGCVPDHLLCAMKDVDILAIESNYDRRMELTSNRPAILKQRIMGGKGHLSNEETFEAVRRVFAQSTQPPQHVVLLHLSRECNDPRIVKRLFEAEPAIAERLQITCQHKRSEWLCLGASPPVQPQTELF